MGDQIRREHATLYLARSQTIAHKVYVVQTTMNGWKCNCPDHRFRGVCKHVHSVEISRMMRKVVEQEVAITIQAHDASRCKFCGSFNVTRKVVVHLAVDFAFVQVSPDEPVVYGWPVARPSYHDQTFQPYRLYYPPTVDGGASR